MNLNKIFLLGRVASDPEMRTTNAGQPVCSFRMVTNRNYTDSAGTKQEKAEFHSIVLWRRLAEIAGQYLTKGSLVLIEGRIETRMWQDNTGTKKYRTEVIGERLQLGPKSANANRPTAGTASQHEEPIGAAVEEEKPATPEEIPIIEEDQSDEISVKDIPF